MLVSVKWWGNVMPAVSALRRLLVRYPVIVLPFVIIACIDFLLFGGVYLLSQSPLSGTFIHVFGGGETRNSMDMVFLPGLFSILRTASSLVFGVVLTGAAISVIQQAFHDRVPSGRFAVSKAVKKYIPFAAVWGLAFTGATAIITVTELILPLIPSEAGALAAAFAASAAVEMMLLYAAPLIIIENRRFADAVKRSFLIARRNPFETAALVLLPNLLALPVVALFAGQGEIVRRFSPEALLYLGTARIVVLTGIDFLMISLGTVFFLRYRRAERMPAIVPEPGR